MTRSSGRALVPALALIIAAAAAMSGCIAPNNAYLMELNRSGKWKEAESVGRDMLAHRRTFTHGQLSETFYHVAYAQARMGKEDEAARTLRDYRGFSASGSLDPEHRWLDREIARLERELGLLDEIKATLVEAMEENGKGDYTRARELCEKSLAMEGLSEVQRATARFVAAAASIRLKDAEAAESHLSAFRALKPALPPESELLRDEAFAVRDLRELAETRK
jgi:hypothetical protein